ncbi:hypothetical protein LAbrini_05610 [Clostridium autoethanogenum]|uniref:CAAX prenyl protease 2/Lysostaphin resistance protein A-like domain-containing protein n=2 Tax=Clostridium TaxID=1485 RepID=D8GQW9_CLOLD|nr:MULTISPECIES: CPBP family glutamic-type intramembrane protease [Clostridium]ADK16274.1 hypothetical protein CLJU_c32270 [Clostridium ljungdahlii DSM 13528]AGY75380.1 hypothetical protein CAETHG_1155 [Clostridium autoethanogenum DSM 10061]ALU35545.1 Hypothetical protein CLAU_1116 [Clostridium autoethanogenum DSM 10061]OAA89857.1 hypothetical protein WX45_01695 [Clostridium ljungdahlii DSM 13528]OVY52393.1 hypothetical protein WX72_01291 [Clostridium autoethanogenum]
MNKIGLKITTAFLWVAIYFIVMLIYTFFDIAIWRKITIKYSNCLNIVFIIACVITFIILLCNRTGYKVRIFKNVTIINIFLAVGCSVLFYFLLDKCFDQIFESLYPASEQAYQNTIQSLLKTPITSLLQVCIIAPVIEEILMRGFVLGGLKDSYGNSIINISSFICSSSF